MKTNQRLEYGRLAEVLSERGLVEPMALSEALQFSGRGNLPFPEALVSANLVQDWELSRVVCELYNLPFITVDIVQPDPKARQGIDVQFLMDNAIVPLSRHGQLLTVCMPAMVPADILGLLASDTDLYILPVVGTVLTNRRWIEANLQAKPLATPTPQSAVDMAGEIKDEQSSEWSSIFDAGDAAVLLDLQHVPTPNDRTS